MYNRSKYVVGKIQGDVGLTAVVFNDVTNHSSMRALFLEDSITSAGFWYVNDNDEVVVYGESESLRLKSKPSDARLVARAIAHPSERTF
jgi:hypothetical protein